MAITAKLVMGLVLVLGLLTFGASAALVIFVTIVFAAQLRLAILHMVPRSDGSTTASAATKRIVVPPFFSIHLAAHDEPPALVMATLRSLLQQENAPPHEIIVIDNNTPDPETWQPVARFCARHPRIRFFHEMNVKGAKAGALSIARERTDPRATHVITVDADYQVTPDFLSHVEMSLAQTGADYLQYPQAYRGESAAPAAALELQDYFARVARHANSSKAVLLTGTLSVISLKALDAVGGWRASTLTEDAELGTRLVSQGFSGRFMEDVKGRGLLPLSATAFETQRARWTLGNLQTLMALPRLPQDKRGAVLTQLTAWGTLTLAALAGFAASLAAMISKLPFAQEAMWLALTTIAVGMAASLLPMALAAKGKGVPTRIVAGAALIRLGLMPSASLATVLALSGYRGKFRVTPKAGCETGGLSLPFILFLSVSSLALVLAVISGSMVGTVAALTLVALPAIASVHLENSMTTYCSTLQENSHAQSSGKYRYPNLQPSLSGEDGGGSGDRAVTP